MGQLNNRRPVKQNNETNFTISAALAGGGTGSAASKQANGPNSQ